jgi:hypothetical protein
MPEFMLMIVANETADAEVAPADTKALLDAHAAYERDLHTATAYLAGERLRPSAEGRRVSRRDGLVRVEVGPFDDTALAGFYLLRADSLDAAIALAQQCPLSPGASVEVRPLMKGAIKPGMTSQQGHVFAFAVLGNANTEQAWIDIMDRIDGSRRNNFPAGGTLAGVRLQPPGQGRTVRPSSGGQRAVFDGPFLESKEVIGGLFFLRMATIDEAVAWASESEMVNHGAVEIRELWRS